jgi:hypothetical protein
MRNANIILVGYLSEKKSHLGETGVNAMVVIKIDVKDIRYDAVNRTQMAKDITQCQELMKTFMNFKCT